MTERIAVIGLGYVGLPVALAFARRFPHTIGFDINPQRIAELHDGYDRTHEVRAQDLVSSTLRVTSDLEELRETTIFVVTVPTPIDENRQPDLGPVIAATRSVGKVLRKGAIVVYESTVYPGVTEEVCGPLLEQVSGLIRGRDFKLGYSPERINPGDKKHTLEKIVKVVAGEDDVALERIANAYGAIIEAGIHRAPSIMVAEAAKVIENTQRDLNIALMNELAIIFERLGIRTADVLAAAGTKWNFLPFRPGLVGGHCIGVDPYYLTAKAESLGYHPEVILAGRRINDSMGIYVAQRTIKMLIQAGLPVKDARVGIMGLSFKENIPDLRNSKVPDVIQELRQFGVEPLVHDPLADPSDAVALCGVELCERDQLCELDALIVAVPHEAYVREGPSNLLSGLRHDGVLVDIKSIFHPEELPPGLSYWSL